eukprot:6832117-Prymnesium_polylepis.1
MGWSGRRARRRSATARSAGSRRGAGGFAGRQGRGAGTRRCARRRCEEAAARGGISGQGRPSNCDGWAGARGRTGKCPSSS